MKSSIALLNNVPRSLPTNPCLTIKQLVSEDASRRRALDADKEAAQLAVQGAVRDVERAVEERQALAAKLHALQGALDEETASRKRMKKQLHRDAEAAKHTMAELNTRCV